ncbi:MAG TPA: hypothetical protein VJN18_28570 [Polyangiaceae bacterium]|nr:hypothetical protein [Polyangiaceae bacterium]
MLVNANETPLGGTTVLACMATTCLFGETEADGTFEFSIDAPANVAVKTHPKLSSIPRQAAALYPARIGEGVFLDLGNVYVPDLPDGVRLGSRNDDAQSLTIGDGLTLTVSPARLVSPVGEAIVDLAAAKIPERRHPPLLELQGEKVLAVYALHPFAVESMESIAIRAPSDAPAGTTILFRTISALDGRLSQPARGHADGDEISTDPSEGITELTWLVVSR